MRRKLMSRWLSLGFLFFLHSNLSAQVFSFNCTRDTVLSGCTANPCFTLQSIIPDLRGLSDSYTINPTSSVPGCVPVYVQPDDPAGIPTLISIDDRYTPVINIGFPFSFYGNLYNSLVVSTNGVVCFDLTKANLFAHFSVNANLPSFSYDPGLIMGPYHDLDPSVAASPTKKIQYQLFGTAPHRRWILSFYKVPLFACNSLFQNTHQIVLYESTGIIEVTIFDKQICLISQNGKAIVGLQDFTRMRGIMAPNRTQTSPPWGSIGMNESWRFVPNGGASLFKRVELYNITGTLLSTGTVTTTGNGTLLASFPNTCPSLTGVTQYVVRSVYQKIDDPAVEIYGSDTVNVSFGSAQQQANVTSFPTSCSVANDGIIRVTPTNGVGPYSFVLDGGTGQTGPIPFNFFNVPAGPHTVTIMDANTCTSAPIPVTVAAGPVFTLNATSQPTSCGPPSGTITVTVPGGTSTYYFQLDAAPGVLAASPYTFNNVGPGPHHITAVDVSGNGCSGAVDIGVTQINTLNANLSSTNTSCSGVSNGTITVTPISGLAPYRFGIDGGTLQNGTPPYTFTNVSAGPHTITLADASGCVTGPIGINVASNPELTANAVTQSTTCSGATNGTVTVTPLSGAGPYTYSLDGAPFVPGGVPHIFTNLAAGVHTVVVTDVAGCISALVPVTVPPGPALTTSVNTTNVLCNGGNTGTITVTQPTIGNAPYQYSLDNINWQAGNTFTGLPAGTYTVYYRESNGCQGSQPVSIGEPALLTSIVSTTPVVCNGQNNGIINVSSAGGIAPYEYSINGGANWQTSPVFNVIAGNYVITIRDANACIITKNITVTEPATLTANSVNSNASCDGGNDGVITVAAVGGNSGYQYSLDGINFQASNIFHVAPGPYTVTVKDNLGCSVTFTTTIGLTTNLTMTPQTDPTICEGTSRQLQLTSNATQYVWTPATGLSNTTISNPVANPVTTTQYIVTATLGRCSADDTIMVFVNPAPIPDAGTPGFICYGQSYQLQGSGGTIFNWTPSTYLNSSTLFNPVTNPAQTTTYSLSVTDANGCVSLFKDDVTVDVTPPIHVNTFPYDTLAHPGDQFQLLATSAASIYNWTPATGLSDATIPNPVLTVGAIGSDLIYKVTASTAAGCKGEGFVKLRVYLGPDIYMPTAFSPNNDGKNDKLTPFPVSITRINYFRVFNRWGQVLFATNKLHDGWDGRFGGREQASGVYVWMVEGVTKDNKIITKRGTALLVR